jgi:hypothetical protein
MNEPKKSIKIDNPIEYFQNNNLFKYANSNSEKAPFQESFKGFDFTD